MSAGLTSAPTTMGSWDTAPPSTVSRRKLRLKPLVVPIARANNSSDQEEAASKIGSFTMCCFKTLIAARTAMGGSFAPATAIITGNTSTTTSKL
jgi:hypothetical protein